ncbi:LIM and calponiny domains-containing protein [Echinococcus granulosus]|uniref:LIM and calponiny domains-containing protein n=1 Tax=Echinococcus granulosus TaxID=6210 RepID=W6VDX5_ECHGR|nr:LIM and calponiny domains-containing protein [Echinococcus granulosus]EUB64969.1 LIM and calponiny domains-containing protein [Echinococcus granulosus]
MAVQWSGVPGNLESWRERRRAAAKALSLELQQHCVVSPQSEVVTKTHTPYLDNNMRDHMGKLKSDLKYTPEKFGESEGSVKRPLPLRIRLMCHSDCVNADYMGMSVVALGDNDGPPFVIQDIVTTTIDTMSESFFKATNLLHIRRSSAPESCGLLDVILADSMADRGHLEVGDELFSVDNLCCSFVADRPILVPKLAKLHQVLERLAKKQRPVEVKVFRSHDSSDRDGARSANPSALKTIPSAADRVSVNPGTANIETKKETLQKSHALSNGSHISRCGGNEAFNKDISEDRGITLVEIEKVHPVRGVQHFVPSAERVVADYSDPEMVYTTPQVEMASTVVMIKGDVELSHAKSPPELVGVSDAVKPRQCGHLLPPVSAVYTNSSKAQSPSSSLEAPTPPPLPPPPLSNSLLSTPSEMSSLIYTISPSPSPMPGPILSRLDRHPSISLLLTPPPPPPSPPTRGNSATQPLLKQPINFKQDYLQLIPNQRCRPPTEGFSSTHQSCYAQGVINSAPIDRLLTPQQRNAKEDVSGQNASPYCTPFPAKVSNSHDPPRSDAYQILHSRKHRQVLESPDDAQYDSDVSSLDDKVCSKPTLSNYSSRRELKVVEPKVVIHREVYENTSLVASDIDDDDFPQSKQGKALKPAKATTAPVLKEHVVEHKEMIEEVDSDRLPNMVCKEQRCTRQEEHEFPKVVASCTKTETLMAEMVTMDTLQSLEEHIDWATPPPPKSFGKFGQVTEVRMREDDQRENTHPTQTDTRLLSSRTLGGPSQNRLRLSSVRAPRVNVIGTWYTCAGCNQQLGTSDLMIIEQLSLFYHLSCFVCARCGIQLSDGQSETSVRIRNGLIYCYICYHRISKSLSRSKERNEGTKVKESPTQRDRHSSLARSTAKIGQLFSSNSPCQSNGFVNSSKR